MIRGAPQIWRGFLAQRAYAKYCHQGVQVKAPEEDDFFGQLLAPFGSADDAPFYPTTISSETLASFAEITTPELVSSSLLVVDGFGSSKPNIAETSDNSDDEDEDIVLYPYFPINRARMASTFSTTPPLIPLDIRDDWCKFKEPIRDAQGRIMTPLNSPILIDNLYRNSVAETFMPFVTEAEFQLVDLNLWPDYTVDTAFDNPGLPLAEIAASKIWHLCKQAGQHWESAQSTPPSNFGSTFSSPASSGLPTPADGNSPGQLFFDDDDMSPIKIEHRPPPALRIDSSHRPWDTGFFRIDNFHTLLPPTAPSGYDAFLLWTRMILDRCIYSDRTLMHALFYAERVLASNVVPLFRHTSPANLPYKVFAAACSLGDKMTNDRLRGIKCLSEASAISPEEILTASFDLLTALNFSTHITFDEWARFGQTLMV